MNTSEPADKLDGIAIVGMSGRFPGACSIDEFWRNLRDGVESLTTFSDEQLIAAGEDPSLLRSPAYVKASMVLDGIDLFDADFFRFTPREAEITNPEHRIFIECAWEALENAGYDPGQYPGRIGVFAGAGTRCTYRQLVASNPQVARLFGDLQRSIAVERDFLTTNVSYRLNLRGPSMAVQTACSTSLVAVHLGCQSLLNGESDMVLAGGVAIRIPQIAGYVYQEGLIYSPDGHCRAFDAKAKGTVVGSGAGIVVLKRLADARSDGDCIRAIIRSSCVNNDGALKIGYTAPSIDGQAAVIAEAHAMAAISADEISYVEAHGTGTSLGDPIEVAALTKAFHQTTAKRAFCSIGSLKTNIGHLDAAAGVAGLIKVILALENQELPPSLNFTEPNPAIDFANSPFYMQQTRSEWQPTNGRRIAGVSSFGIGGTNAHVIVEEAPRAVRSEESNRWQLIPISGRTPAAVETATSRLAEALACQPNQNIADVAFTLQEGRKAFAYRRALVVNDQQDAIKVLQSLDPKRLQSNRAFDGDATVAFMFPAQGAQYVNMGRALYDVEPVFREQVDYCLNYLEPLLKQDLRTLLFPEDADLLEASEQLRQTRLTQPAVFTVSYALARLWMSWGIKPAAVLGHSLGEYVAAAVAGVFKLEDALAIVAERGRLMQELPPGRMLAVHLPDGELRHRLPATVSLASVNAPRLSVVAGPTGSIESLAESLRTERIETQQLHTSHAFHSAMMDPMVAPLVDAVSRVQRHPPEIPFISTVTGAWIAADEAMDPGYWGRQAREAVQFGPAVGELLKTPGRVLLEVGPGTTLSTLARLQLNRQATATAVSSLRQAQENRPDYQCMLNALGFLWTAGVAIDWKQIEWGENRRRVPLPTYPFDRKRYWVDHRQDVGRQSASSGSQAGLSHTGSVMTNQVNEAPTEEAQSVPPGTAALYSRPDLQSEYVAPQSELEERLANVWRDFFAIEKVGIRDSFFDLGGNSLIATQLITTVQDLFKCKLSVGEFFENPTIEAMARVVQKESGEIREKGRIYVVLRRGAKTLSVIPENASLIEVQSAEGRHPFFIVDGYPYFIDVVKLLGADQPVLSLITQERIKHKTNYDIVEEAATHMQTILRRQPHGPYIVGGCSASGIVAYEVAQQLRDDGHEVGLVVLFDTANPYFTRQYSALYTSMLYHVAALKGLRWPDIPAYIAGKFSNLGGRHEQMRDGGANRDAENSADGAAEFHSEFVYTSARIAAARKYIPRPYAGRLLLFRGYQRLSGRYTDPLLGWGDVVRGKIESCQLNTQEHLEIFKSEWDRALVAQKLRSAFDEVCAAPLPEIPGYVMESEESQRRAG